MMIKHVRPTKFSDSWRTFARYLCCLPLIFCAVASAQSFTRTATYGGYSTANAFCQAMNPNYSNRAKLGLYYSSTAPEYVVSGGTCTRVDANISGSGGASATCPRITGATLVSRTPGPDSGNYRTLGADICNYSGIDPDKPPEKCEAGKDMGTQEAWNVSEIDMNGGNLTCSPSGCELSISFEGMLVGPDSQGIYGPATQTGNECEYDENGGGEDPEPNPEKCPNGYVPSKYAANVCVPEEEPERECPNGHVPSRYVTGVCVPEKEPNRQCPEGFSLHSASDTCVPEPKEPTPPKPDGSGSNSGEGDGEGEGGKCGAPGQPRCNVHDVNVEAAVRDVEKAVDINTEAVVENTKEVVATKRAVDKNTEAVKEGAKETKSAVDAVKTSVDATKTSVDGVKDAVESGTSKLDQTLKAIEGAIKDIKPGVGGGGGGDGEGDGEGEETDLDKYCEANPKALPCSGIEEVEGEGEGTEPETITITYQEESLFSGTGSCPADAVSSVGGQNMVIWDWSTTCGFISSYMRPLVIALALMSALMILIPRNE